MAYLKPIITEKTIRLAHAGQFSFTVDGKMTKPQIAAAVDELFKVNTVRVNIVNLPGKTRRTGTRRLPTLGQKRFKAVVTLKPGQKIEYFESKEEKKKK
ncbi:MAG TPA: 50S ribosomal protein L23 [Patescibacteria group bacterium]|nr:50S ribosomal protein L23 [Patescibacteria group bacterium]